ncbi:MAG: 2,4'-dihydroxyacetophenone dioxygenase family protein [Acidimicrobiia bacterium]
MSNVDELVGLGRPAPEDPSTARTAYRRPQSPDLVGDVIVEGALTDDERLWVPQSQWVSFRPLLFGVSHGYYVNLLRVRRAGVLSRHRHSGPVHAWVIKGSWHYLEHDWVASEGTYAFEAPAETHTLVVPDDVEEMITMFHVTGGLVYVDPDGSPTGYEDAHTKLTMARAHYEAVGLGASFADQFVR